MYRKKIHGYKKMTNSQFSNSISQLFEVMRSRGFKIKPEERSLFIKELKNKYGNIKDDKAREIINRANSAYENHINREKRKLKEQNKQL